jgi:hypothetical protein
MDSTSIVYSNGYYWCGARFLNLVDSVTQEAINVTTSELFTYSDNTFTFTPETPGVYTYNLYFTLEDYTQVQSESLKIKVSVIETYAPYYTSGGPSFQYTV